MDATLFSDVKEASYLSTKKTYRYRPIIRYMYEQKRIFNTEVLPNEIFNYLIQYPQFGDYTMEELFADLNALVKSNNLTEIPDNTEVEGIEEFKRNRRLFVLTDFTFEIEKMLTSFEKNFHRIGTSLEPTLPEKLYNALHRLRDFSRRKNMDKEDLVFLNEVWEDMFDKFLKLDNNASMYLSHINAEKLEVIMAQPDAFIVFKDEFVAYLTNFIIGLKKNAPYIEQILRDIEDPGFTVLKKYLIQFQRTIPKTEVIPDSDFEMAYDEIWLGVTHWFISIDEKESKVRQLERRTNSSIVSVTKLAQQAAERQFYTRNRKTDYLHLAKMVHQQNDLEEAGELFSFLFGFDNIKHFKTNGKETDSTKYTIWDCQPEEVDITYRAKQPTDKQTKRSLKVPAMGEEALQRKRMLEAQRDYEDKEIKKLLDCNYLALRELGTVESFIRNAILTWINKGMLSKMQDSNICEGRTEHGVKFKLAQVSDDIIELHSPDGILKLPDYEFTFSEVK
ncbi:TIGR02677 family protein [Paenibacillus tianjinensis]|uniref:TIGR02677 family protein n=1 Tax=Paenibacillus tianjinensis TaxID=2810347 RepID=A0ABX7LEK3_9BACL|nr:TIGR02677 family protein [Paenibacillus tianjinensis]QSF46535.1 TIGR02677 family protein [Paenibacillus tianjinensis]